MRRIVFFFFLAILNYPILAQDTVFRQEPDSNYFYNKWLPIDSLLQYSWMSMASMHADYCSVRMESKGNIIVYGIAVCAGFDTVNPYEDEGYSYYVYNRSFDSVFEDFSIYKLTPAPTMVSEPKRLQLNVTPVSYYWDMGQIDNRPAIFPTYELYFENPVVLSDTFYVGSTGYCSNSYYDTVTDMLYSHTRWPVKVYWLNSSQYDSYFLEHYSTGWRNPSYPLHMFQALIFPILTPQNSPNDTIDTGEDTLSIAKTSPLDRFVVTKPNPASTSVQVVSSVGLSSIDVTDINGRTIYKTPTSGMNHTIIVSEWSHGPYLFTIKTPMGETRKKVLIQ